MDAHQDLFHRSLFPGSGSLPDFLGPVSGTSTPFSLTAMRTLLSQFCEEFDAAVRPLLEPLRRTADTLAESSPHEATRAVLPSILDVADQFTVLADKVAEQQAYVLIFGPLKSGKSTLMNAMSAAYVSEVTSLPAYPCMVYVSDSDHRKFTVTRYNGDTEVFQDPAALRIQVARAHTELADRIRGIEDAGTEFDPALHFDEAIRRVDVKVPAGDLAHSGSVLVDTPGLYSRMKFGYDRMTKEFRNAAACAIFVVKTDNLFLEQVFDEFNKLLDLFSRIFLVVNLDSTKRDVMPDGTLVPSLESDDPIRVVEAFENLSMSAPLKAAADEGRLRIYPVDLMNAAARRLSKEGTPAAAAAKQQSEGIAHSRQADFDSFMGDLSDYLNSTDYLVSFLGDSLRRALTLLSEATASSEHKTVRKIEGRLSQLEDDRESCQEKLEALERLAAYDWGKALSTLKQELDGVGSREAEAVRDSSVQVVAEKLDSWFNGDASLKSLVETDLLPWIESSQRQLALAVHKRLTEEVASGASGISLPHEVARDLFTIELQFGEFGRGGLDSVDPVAGVSSHASPITASTIPVRKTLWDWLLFRSQAKCQERLFGTGEAGKQRIPRELKAKRLGEAGRLHMQTKLAAFQEEQLPTVLKDQAQRIFVDYSTAVTQALTERLNERRTAFKEELEQIEENERQLNRIGNRFEEMAVSAAHARASIQELSSRYQEADPDHLVRPIEQPSDAAKIPTPPATPLDKVEESSDEEFDVVVEGEIEDFSDIALEGELEGEAEIEVKEA